MSVSISGFTYIRNGFRFGYPFVQAFGSILPICDELVVAVGDSDDGTREAILDLDRTKVRIIDTVWDMDLREGGRLFAQQANLALDRIRGDWGFHIQADEVIHEDDLPKIRQAIERYHDDPKVEGLLLPFLNFWGSYGWIGTSRRWHRQEVRLVRNRPGIRSFRDSQGFRAYSSREAWEEGSEKGRKLRVKRIDAPVYHYNYVRHPRLMKAKADYFNRFWHDDDWLARNTEPGDEVDYSQVEGLMRFEGRHPGCMQPLIEAQDWEFHYDPGKVRLGLKERILYEIERITGWRPGEYRNYVEI
jgi:glycosyltransferase involved in cell wall biosynthesis